MPEAAGPMQEPAETLVKTAWLTATANIQWFTKISPDGSCLIPDFTNQIARIGALLERFGPNSYDYRLFI